MAMSAVMSWLGRPMHLNARQEPVQEAPRVEPVLVAAPDSPPPLPRAPHALDWTIDRLATTDSLWGDGYQFPGGEEEALRLAKPLGLSAASSLLLIGVGGGGPACSIAMQLGAWVSGFEADKALAEAAMDRVARRNLTKRAQIETWDPAAPVFRVGFYHHALALEPLHGSNPERTLTAIARALKPSGHLAMIEIVADKPLDPADPVVAGWARLDRRDPRLVPPERIVTRILRKLKFDVRVAEDLSERHTHQALSGWQTAVQAMEDVRPTRRGAMSCVEEAELWLMRLRLFEVGALRLVRWHAIGGG